MADVTVEIKAGVAVEIEPSAANIRIEVAPDGVFIGFFAEDGRSAILNMETISALSLVNGAALQAWVADRRKQAAALANGAALLALVTDRRE